MPYLDISIIKSSCLTTQEKELYGWYFNELSMGYYTSISGSRQERRACQWMQELTAHFWADVERTMKAARARLTDNLTQMMTTQCNMDSLDREEEKRKMRELHELLSMSVEAGEREVFGAAGGKYRGEALTASHWS